MKKLLMLASLAFALATPAAAFDAGSKQMPKGRSQVVSYADLDVGTKKGATELQRRIRIAVDNVCGEVSPWNLSGNIQAKRCHRDTMKSKSAEASAAIARAGSAIRLADNR